MYDYLYVKKLCINLDIQSINFMLTRLFISHAFTWWEEWASDDIMWVLEKWKISFISFTLEHVGSWANAMLKENYTEVTEFILLGLTDRADL